MAEIFPNGQKSRQTVEASGRTQKIKKISIYMAYSKTAKTQR